MPRQVAAARPAGRDLDRYSRRVEQPGEGEQRPGQASRRILVRPVDSERPGHLGRGYLAASCPPEQLLPAACEPDPVLAAVELGARGRGRGYRKTLRHITQIC